MDTGDINLILTVTGLFVSAIALALQIRQGKEPIRHTMLAIIGIMLTVLILQGGLYLLHRREISLLQSQIVRLLIPGTSKSIDEIADSISPISGEGNRTKLAEALQGLLDMGNIQQSSNVLRNCDASIMTTVRRYYK